MDREILKAFEELLDKKLEPIKEQLKEHTQILRSLEHASEVHKADIDNLTHEVAELSGEVKGIRKDLAQVEMVTASNWNEIAKIKAVK